MAWDNIEDMRVKVYFNGDPYEFEFEEYYDFCNSYLDAKALIKGYLIACIETAGIKEKEELRALNIHKLENAVGISFSINHKQWVISSSPVSVTIIERSRGDKDLLNKLIDHFKSLLMSELDRILDKYEEVLMPNN